MKGELHATNNRLLSASHEVRGGAGGVRGRAEKLNGCYKRKAMVGLEVVLGNFDGWYDRGALTIVFF